MLVVATGYLTLSRKPSQSKRPNSTTVARSREATLVKTMVVRAQLFEESIVATGTVHAEESVEVQAEVAGKLTQIKFKEGSFVKAGDLLASINDAELRASLQQAVYRRELGHIKAQRITALVEKGGVPRQEYDIATNELNVLKAEVSLIEAQLARTEIRAPFTGIIGLRHVSEGAQVTPTTRLATLQDIASMKLDFTVAERYAGIVKPGCVVKFTVVGSDRTYTAEIYAVEPHLDELTRTRLIRARAPNSDQSLIPGAFARVIVPLGRRDDALLIPATAVAAEGIDKTVFVVDSGKARRQVVQTGVRRAENILITSGLHSGDEVIVAGTQQVRAGGEVEALKTR